MADKNVKTELKNKSEKDMLIGLIHEINNKLNRVLERENNTWIRSQKYSETNETIYKVENINVDPKKWM